MGATGILNCLDGATGRTVWPARDVLADAGSENARWGKSCSPLVLGDLVIVTGGSGGEASLLAYDRATGELRWKSKHASTRWQAYASPMIAELCGQRQILTMNDNHVAGHDPADGRLLWEREWPGAEPKVSQPIPLTGDELFVASGYGVGCVRWKFTYTDRDGFAIQELWHTRNLKPKFTNAVRHGDFIYGLDDGILVCIDLADGKRRWKEGRYYNGQIMLVGDLILVQAEDGNLVLVEANPREHCEVARFPALTSVTWNNPAFAPPYLVVRNDVEMACFEVKLAQ
jgi:outer membrane protein assembly factor BamB